MIEVFFTLSKVFLGFGDARLAIIDMLGAFFFCVSNALLAFFLTLGMLGFQVFTLGFDLMAQVFAGIFHGGPRRR